MKRFLINDKKVVLRRAMLILIGSVCYLYSLYGSSFAELNIKFPFLDFPVFIGEFLFLLCFLITLFFYRTRLDLVEQRVLVVCVVYIVWVLFNALWGYYLFGPISLRNAALFYYPLFSLFGYILLEQNLAKSQWPKALAIFLLFNLYFLPITNYFIIVYCILAFGFFWHLRQSLLKFLGITLVFIYIINSKIIFDGPRSHIIGIIFMLTFLLLYFLCGIIRVKRNIKMGVAAVICIIFLMGLMKYWDQNSLKSMTTLSSLQELYIKYDQEIQDSKASYTPAVLTPKVYCENPRKQKKEGGAVLVNNRQLNSEIFDAEHNPKQTEGGGSVLVSNNQLNPEILDAKHNELPQDVSVFSNDDKTFSRFEDQPATAVSLPMTPDALTSPLRTSFLAPAAQRNYRQLEVAYHNILFRLYIWRDMIDELKEKNAWWGVGFGHPQRSPSIEILGWASGEWRRDGWITPHNSFLHMIYRGGIVGVLSVLTIIGVLAYLVRVFLKHRSIWGGLLVACLMYWIGISNFLVILELPYNAIPFWTFFGMTVAYGHALENRKTAHG